MISREDTTRHGNGESTGGGMSTRPLKVIFISYDGLGDPLGRSQVLPYVAGLARRGHEFELISFEKPGTKLCWRDPIAPGVRWTALRYHRVPTVPASSFDITQGFSVATALSRGTDLLHMRSYMPATMTLALSQARRIPMLFDMRGLWADEKVDAGTWSREGRLYAGAKAMERVLLRNAAGITMLTHSGQRYLRDEYPFRDEITAPIHVIPTCADLNHFTTDIEPHAATLARVGGHRVLLYVGSLGGWYLQDEMARFYLAWREHQHRHGKTARFLVITRDDVSQLARVLDAKGAASELVRQPATRDEVPSMMRCGHAAVCFIRDSFSKRASAPTKLGELLACGLPVAANIVGDMGQVLGNTPAGVVVESMDDESLQRAAAELARRAEQATTSAEARKLAERWFELDRAIEHYDVLYRQLFEKKSIREPADRTW